MQVEMEMPAILREEGASSVRQPLSEQPDYQETQYRWVVVVLTSFCLLLNGLVNNAVAPIQHKMTLIYSVSEKRVGFSVIISFLVFFLANFPANKIIDKYGMRISLCLGTGLFFIGTFFFLLINLSYNFVILGTVFVGLGQPFLLNSPAKVATLWFFPKNRALATAVMVGSNLFAMGFGFLIPTMVVEDDSLGQIAQKSIQHLYLGYFVMAGTCLVLSLMFMQAKPEVPPSEGAVASKLYSLTESFQQIRKNQNLWRFFLCYSVHYGTFISLMANSNFIVTSYGYSDIEIAINIVLLMVGGTVGSVLASLYLKKTGDYQKTLRTVVIGAALMLALLTLWLNTVNSKVGTSIIMLVMGFIGNPEMPICYQLGCELSFPIGEATVTGLLNGGALLWAFLSSIFVTSVFGYSSSKSSLVILIILSIFVMLAGLSFFCVKMELKRKQYEEQQNKKGLEKGEQEEQRHEQHRSAFEVNLASVMNKNYDELVEEDLPQSKAEDGQL